VSAPIPPPSGTHLHLVPDAPAGPPERREPRMDDDIEALGVRCLHDATIDRLHELSPLELYAAAFDLSENDLAESILNHAADTFGALHACLHSKVPPSETTMERLLHRTSMLMRVGIELHRRQRAAAFALRTAEVRS